MNKPYYEIHITVKDQPKKREEWDAFAKEFKWKTSYIVGDPLLGKDGFFYFTGHEGEYDKAYHGMEVMAAMLTSFKDAQVLRKKIEHVVYDTKLSLVPNEKD